MNRRNGSPPPPPDGVAKDMGELMCDIVSLAELQFELFRIDCRVGLQRMLIPGAMLLAAGIVSVGTVPIALLLVAELCVQLAGLSRTVALSIATLSGLIVAVAVGVVGWYHIRGVARAFQRSRDEFTRNTAWIKGALKPPAPIESQQSQDRRYFPGW